MMSPLPLSRPDYAPATEVEMYRPKPKPPLNLQSQSSDSALFGK